MFEDFVELTARVPWWIGVLLAVASYLILHNLAAIKVTGSVKPGQIGNFVPKQLGVTLAYFGQFVFPVAFLLGAVFSAIKKQK
jgi:restriction system protein